MSVKYALLGTLLLAASPALAQECSTQSPPSFSGNMGAVSSCNSLPSGAATAEIPTFGGNLAVTRVGPAGPARLAPAFGAPAPITPQQEPVLSGDE
jgi:hypothetical protein